MPGREAPSAREERPRAPLENRRGTAGRPEFQTGRRDELLMRYRSAGAGWRRRAGWGGEVSSKGGEESPPLIRGKSTGTPQGGGGGAGEGPEE